MVMQRHLRHVGKDCLVAFDANFYSPQALRKAGRRRLIEVIRPRAPRMAERLVDDIFAALDEQTVVVPGTGTLGVIVPSLAKSLAAVHEQ